MSVFKFVDLYVLFQRGIQNQIKRLREALNGLFFCWGGDPRSLANKKTAPLGEEVAMDNFWDHLPKKRCYCL